MFSLQHPKRYNERALRLFDYLKAFAPGFHLEEGDWEKAFRHIWPGRKMDQAEFRNKQSLLKRYLIDFLSWKEFQETPEEKSLLYLRQLRKRGLQHLFERESRRIQGRWQSADSSLEEEIYYRYRLSDESNILFGQSQVRKSDENLLAKLDYLDHYYLRVRLRETCELLNRQQLLNAKARNDFFEAWLNEKIGEASSFEDPVIRLYLQIYRCYKFGDREEEFTELVRLIREFYHLFPLSEAKAIFRHAQNHSIRQINQGKAFYLKELLDLFEFQLEEGIIFQDGMLDHSDYKNIVVVALRLERFDWAESFIQDYQEQVHPTYRSSVYQFCQASLLEARGKQDEAIRFLREVSFSDIFYEISSRILLIRLYFEKGDWEGLFYANDAFERFLKRSQSISRERKAAHLGFTWAVRQLSKLRERRVNFTPKEYQERSEKLARKIRNKTYMTQLKWVLDQLED